ncbi:MAG TPA: glycosyltransferase family 2 protein [Nostocaceae cyanobacterium]|nr:glycosyltransferase family 2 protein [Nostocaceae cyanobacterium]
MNNLAILLSNVLLVWLVTQVILTLVFLLNLRSHPKNITSEQQLPKTAIILSLRGADPFLPKCIQALLKQNYPDYDLKIIVDSKEDPAWQIAHETISLIGATDVQISVLEKVSYKCGLKCSSLIQAVNELDDSYKVVALVDADTIVYPHWLRELVTPLANPKVGATTGNRWYLPTGKYWGSIVRYIWNVSATIQMYLYQIPWAGSFAIKTEVLHQTGLIEKWGLSLSDDTIVTKILRKHGLQVKFVPSLMMLNSEDCDLSSLFGWLTRQILWAKLYHPSWWAIVADTCLTVILSSSFLLLFFVALWTKQVEAAAIFIRTYGIYMTTLLLLIIALDRTVQKVIASQGNAPTKLSLFTAIRILITIPLSQWVCGISLFSTFWISTVKWRGVNYRVLGPWDIQLVEYSPYQSSEQTNDSKISL